MSKKLKKAIYANVVQIHNKTAGEVQVRYRDRDGKQMIHTLGTFATVEMAPKLTDPMLLLHSNLETLVKSGLIEIL